MTGGRTQTGDLHDVPVRVEELSVCGPYPRVISTYHRGTGGITVYRGTTGYLNCRGVVPSACLISSYMRPLKL